MLLTCKHLCAYINNTYIYSRHFATILQIHPNSIPQIFPFLVCEIFTIHNEREEVLIYMDCNAFVFSFSTFFTTI